MRTQVLKGLKGGIKWLPDERSLEPQAVERLDGIYACDAIVCTGGILWVTQEGDPDDYMLRKGETFVARHEGVVVVQAIAKATYRITGNYERFDRRNKWPVSFPG